MFWQKAILVCLIVTLATAYTWNAEEDEEELNEELELFHQELNEDKHTHGESVPSQGKGRKIVFDYSTNNVKPFYSHYQPKIQEGSEEEMKNLQWILVTRDGYEYKGTLDEVKEMLKDYNTAKDMDHVLSSLDEYSNDGVQPADEYDGDTQNILEKRRKKRTVLGIDTRILIPFKGFPYSTMGRIDVGCTGTFISSRGVLTAAHCLYNRATRRFYANLDIRRNKKCDPDTGEHHQWMFAIIPHGYGIRGLRSHDFGMVFYCNDTTEWMGYGHDKNFKAGARIKMHGYPGDKPKQCLWRSECSIKKSFRQRVRYFCDTAPGMSGSGILAPCLKRNVVYGVHTNGADRFCRDKFGVNRPCNSGVRINNRVFRRLNSWINAFN